MGQQMTTLKTVTISPELGSLINSSPLVRRADVVAFTAHAARGQTRADGITPYITHPRRVATLVIQWVREMHTYEPFLDILVAAALLHDVVEDTKMRYVDVGYALDWVSGSDVVIKLVELLTKPAGDKPAPREYYDRIKDDEFARLVKAADRASNLEDALDEVKAGRNTRRWEKYAEKTEIYILPMYGIRSLLGVELYDRLRDLYAAIHVSRVE